MIVGLGGVSAKQHVSVVMYSCNLDSGLKQELVRIASSRAPHGIETNFQAGFADHIQIDNFSEPLQIARFDVERFAGGTGRLFRNCRVFAVSSFDLGFNFFRNFRQGWAAIGSRELDSVVLWRIVGGGEIDYAIRMVLCYRVCESRSGRGFRHQHRCDSVSLQNLGGHGTESFAQKTRIATDNYFRSLRLLGGDIAGNAAHGAPYVGKGELLGHHGAPTRGAKLDL